MADRFKPCSVDSCNGNAHHEASGRKGFCGMHYARLSRHGDPLTRKKIGNGEAPEFFQNIVLNFDRDDCLIWPFSKSSNGYGVLHFEGKKQRASRLACEIVNGPPPTPKHEAAHSCGNGHLGCVNPRHVTWKTRSDNQMDRVEHGTSNRGTRHGQVKLTEANVREIRALEGSMGQSAIGRRFGINQSHVRDILTRRIWAWLE